MRKVIWIGLLISLALAIFLSPFASKFPDGLEKVASEKGFMEKADGKNIFSAPIPDYQIPGMKHETVSIAAAGAIGTILVFVISYVFGYTIKRKKIEPRQ